MQGNDDEPGLARDCCWIRVPAVVPLGLMNRSKHTGRTGRLLTRTWLVAATLAMVGAVATSQAAHADGYLRRIGYLPGGACIPSDLGSVRSVASAAGWQYAVLSDGSIRSWGWTGGISVPNAPVRPGVAATAILCGSTGWYGGVPYTVLVTYEDGLMLGANSYGTSQFPTKPFAVPGLVQIAFLNTRAIGRMSNGDLQYLFRPLGEENSLIASNVTDFATSGTFGAYRKADGSIWPIGDYTAWNPVWGQWPPSAPPGSVWTAENCRQRPSEYGAVVQLAPGWERVVALRADGSAIGWGLNDVGQCDFPTSLGPIRAIRCADYYRSNTLLMESGEVIMWPPGHGFGYTATNLGAVSQFSQGSNQDTLVLTDTPQLVCIGDFTGFDPANYAQRVDGEDLGVLLAQWGPVTTATVSDINADGIVNGADLGDLLNAWGECPH